MKPVDQAFQPANIWQPGKAAPPLRRLTRDNLGQFVTGEVWTGHAARADIRMLELDGRRYVVKDFSGKGFLARCALGRHLVGHEWRIYRRLAGVPGIPAVHRRIDACAFIMEYVDGRPLKDFYHDPVSDVFVRRLEALVAAMHDRGVVHLDLHQRRNIIVTPDDRPCLIDFATAVYLGRSAFAREVLIPFFGAFDVGGVLKVKKFHAPHLLTPIDQKRLRLMERFRKLWFFTPVHVSKRKHPCPQPRS